MISAALSADFDGDLVSCVVERVCARSTPKR